MEGWGTVLATFGLALLGGLVPFINVEAYLLGVSALSPQSAALPLVLAASLGQMTAKSVLYLAGRGAVRWPVARGFSRLNHMRESLTRRPGRTTACVFVSAVTGIPPFYGVSLTAGVLRLRYGRFLAVGLSGRVIRFAAVFLLPRFVMSFAR